MEGIRRGTSGGRQIAGHQGLGDRTQELGPGVVAEVLAVERREDPVGETPQVAPGKGRALLQRDFPVVVPPQEDDLVVEGESAIAQPFVARRRGIVTAGPLAPELPEAQLESAEQPVLLLAARRRRRYLEPPDGLQDRRHLGFDRPPTVALGAARALAAAPALGFAGRQLVEIGEQLPGPLGLAAFERQTRGAGEIVGAVAGAEGPLPADHRRAVVGEQESLLDGPFRRLQIAGETVGAGETARGPRGDVGIATVGERRAQLLGGRVGTGGESRFPLHQVGPGPQPAPAVRAQLERGQNVAGAGQGRARIFAPAHGEIGEVQPPIGELQTIRALLGEALPGCRLPPRRAPRGWRRGRGE